jgi:hypothetical protein
VRVAVVLGGARGAAPARGLLLGDGAPGRARAPLAPRQVHRIGVPGDQYASNGLVVHALRAGAMA